MSTAREMVEAERERFETFQRLRKNRGQKTATMFDRLEDGTYRDESVQRHWWTWQNAIRQPGEGALTDEQIEDLWAGASDPDSAEVSIYTFARAIERAHGITSTPTGDSNG